MKCPHCNYEDKRSEDSKFNSFFMYDGNTLQLTRRVGNRHAYIIETAAIVGCPSCKKVFISD